PRHIWRGRFTLLPILSLQVRIGELCQQSEGVKTHSPFAADNKMGVNNFDAKSFIFSPSP
ncbi:hypothetical protein, partial [Yersinia enterocolitica]|uniref:hypothetical protein n=1 Tax=Yersinia enterocolitica TaxID=630 RepID=UPI00398BBB4C